MSPKLLRVALQAMGVPSYVIDVVLLVVGLAPELRAAVAALVRAIEGGDDVEARRAYEAARRAAFVARQRR